MQTEYAITGVSDKHRVISVVEIGVFCDRTVLADTNYLQKSMLNHNSRITESFHFGFCYYYNTFFRKCQPCRAKKSEYIDAPGFFSIAVIYGDFSAILHRI